MARQLVEGERVQARYYATNKAIWKFGRITKKLGNLHYIVTLDNGFVFKRHINQLRSTNVQPTHHDTSNEQLPADHTELTNQHRANIEDVVVIPNDSADQNNQRPPLVLQPSSSLQTSSSNRTNAFTSQQMPQRQTNASSRLRKFHNI